MIRMSVHQGLTINDVDSMCVVCHLRDAKIGLHSAAAEKFVRRPKLRNRTRLSLTNNAHLTVLAGKRWSAAMNTNESCWVNGVLPEPEC